MRKAIYYLFVTFILFLFSTNANTQDYTFEDFVGTWNGTIMSPSTYGNTIPMTMTIEPDGYYTETSGVLMPDLYPNTQQCEYQAESNRMHWWYLGTAWGGQYFYDHFFYEVVYFENGVLEMHYNYWDDPEPHPETGIIYLVKEGATVMPPPETLSYNWMDNSVTLNWNEPDPGNGQLAELTGYNVYHQTESSEYEIIGFTETTDFEHEDMFEAGLHGYYVTAVYEDGESDPSGEISILFLTPAPESLEGMYIDNSVELSWEAPEPGENPMATVTGYILYHQAPDGSVGILENTEEMMFTHEDSFAAGTHSYYVVATYEGGVSPTSNMVTIDFMTPAPANLAGLLTDDMIELTWEAPEPGDEAMATLEGYNVYHMPENGDWEMLAYVETNAFIHENLQSTGTHYYYVTAAYLGGESDPSNQTEVLYQITGIGDEPVISASVFPNPATDFVNVTSEQEMQSVKIMNQAGQVVLEDVISGNKYRADVRNLQQGVYVLLIETNSGNSSNMIVVK